MQSEAPAGWQWTRIGSHFKRITRKNTAGIERVLTASGEHGLIDQEEYFNKRVAAKNVDGYFHLKRGEFAYNRSSMNGYPFGATKRLDRYDDGVLSTLYLCFGLRPKAAILSDYAAQLFDSRVLDAELLPIVRVGARAHGLLNVTPSDFMEVQFLLPPLAEQKKIAAILSSVDEAIQATEAVIEQTRRVKDGLLQDLLTRGIGHTRFKHPQKWVIGRLPEIEEIPESWRVVPIRTVAQLETGHTPSRGNDEYWNGDVQWLSLHDTKRMATHYVSETALTITAEGIANSSARLLPEGTVALSRTATVGKCVILGTEMATSQDFACYICGDRLHNKYLLHLFRYMQHVWTALGGGSTHQTVYMPAFKKLQILLPPKAEQIRIAEIMDAHDAETSTLLSQVKQLRQIKAGLLQDLLTGVVRVSP